jgi:hypothetical protein
MQASSDLIFKSKDLNFILNGASPASENEEFDNYKTRNVKAEENIIV